MSPVHGPLRIDTLAEELKVQWGQFDQAQILVRRRSVAQGPNSNRWWKENRRSTRDERRQKARDGEIEGQ